MHKTEGLVKWAVVFLKHIRILARHMIVIYIKQHMTWIFIQYAPTHCPKMSYHTGILCCIVVKNVHVFLSQVRNNIRTTQINFLQYFSCIQNGLSLYYSWSMPIWKIYVVFLRAKDCTKCKTIHKDRAYNVWEIDFWLSYMFIHTTNTKPRI